MKVYAFNGSPHQKGSVYTGLRVVADELEKEGIGVEFVQIGDKVIRGCTGCGTCKKTGRCVFGGDPVNSCLDMMADADGLIVGSPVYYGGVAGTMKCFLDRFFYAGPDLRFKVAAAVVSLRRSGGVPAFQQLNSYFSLAQMVITPTQYWSAIHGTSPGEVAQDGEGNQMLRTAGRNMAWLLKVVRRGLDEFTPPQQEPRVRTNFIR
jgi:multimeric flavodoxin WrbA